MYLHLIFGLIIILSDFIYCNINKKLHNNKAISCEEILENFKIGFDSFEFENNFNEYLATNGYTAQENEPFTIIFNKSVVCPSLPENITKEFFQINSILRGTQKIFDNYIGHYNNIERPANDEIKEFLNKASECIPDNIKCNKKWNIVCDPNELYRSFDGKCNNLENPMKGAAFTAYNRLVEEFYDDNILDVRKNWQGNQLNSPRKIVNDILSENKEINKMNLKNEHIPNMGWYMFGQFLTHDIAGTIPSLDRNNNINTPFRCCSADYKNFITNTKMIQKCLPFDIPFDDKYHKKTKLFCHNFIRSQPFFQNNCHLGPAQQLNRVTHFIDLSTIYSVSKDESQNLRTFSSGLLKTDENNILPIQDGECTGSKCYFTGDSRAVLTPQLALIHSLFVRLHNEIAINLKQMAPEWNDEKLFQESRRINIAIYQNIVFNEFLPILIGEQLVLSNYYNETVDPLSTNDFITGFFRTLHMFMPSHFELYNTDYIITNCISISNMIMETEVDYLKTNFSDIIKSLLLQKININDLKDEVINKLFNGTDLISVDIQRGRDHGIAPYWRYRQFCGQPIVKDFSDLYPMISRMNIKKLEKVYTSVLDIDIFVGGHLEEKGNNNLMGPTFNCITKIQFARYHIGDRFFYLHKNNPYPFTERQLQEIQNISFGKLLCLVTNETKIPQYSFLTSSLKADNMVECSSLKDLQYSVFKN